jgi:GNAT superfamily N-acetyltransferase
VDQQYQIEPVTPGRAGDLAAFGEAHGKFGYCSCLRWRLRSGPFGKMTRAERSDTLTRLVRDEQPVGVLAYDGDEPVGWAAVAPRSDTSFSRSRAIPHVDELPAWSLWCIRVRAGHRGQGITHALIAGAVEFARAHGAPAIEAYPLDNGGARVDTTMAYAGIRKNFERANFSHVADTTSVLAGHPRILMRLDLR